MEKDAKIYVAGHRGMVGSALVRKLTAEGYANIIVRSHEELDLTRQVDVEAFFAAERPEYVFLVAAKKGSVAAVKQSPADFLYVNSIMELNVISAASRNGCKKLIFIGSACVYSGSADPIKESSLMSAPMDEADESYGLAKILGMKYCSYLAMQYNVDFISVVPPNLYGPNDNYQPFNSNVLAAQIRRFHEAKEKGLSSVTCWGDGTPRRDFLYVDDLADMCVFLMDHYRGIEPVNAGTGKDISIKELTEIIAKVIGYHGEICWDIGKPNGVFRKLLDTTKAIELGWKPKTSLEDGIQVAYKDYLSIRGYKAKKDFKQKGT